jgi:uncharacterized membrane protein YeaQ/YmgE (transglycosylase-associated protein family)
MINFIIWLIVGGLLGWIASMIMRTDGQQGIFLNIVVGIVGAMLAGFLLSPLFGESTINSNNFSLGGLLISLVGAIILLGIVNLFRRGTVR